MGCECWNSVCLYGPTAEIERFRTLCIDLPPGSDPVNVQGGWEGYEVELGFQGTVAAASDRHSGLGIILSASNYRENVPEPGRWSFYFDTVHDFPEDLFEELASLFPTLHFSCECIDSMDDFMGYGWFNVPPGGEAFRQDIEVPENFWTGGGGFKRKPAADAKHSAIVKALMRAAQQVDSDFQTS